MSAELLKGESFADIRGLGTFADVRGLGTFAGKRVGIPFIIGLLEM
jgi:hypothetical protein